MKPIFVVCHHKDCKWAWQYNGKKKQGRYITCPNCYRKIKLPIEKKVKE
jgi:hypothetical protein